MDDTFDFGAMLKQLDDLDAKDYTYKAKKCASNVNEMAAPQDPLADSNMSDFDNSDEDLASLLGDDDDDDIFAKKIYGSSPIKKVASEVSSSVAKTTGSQGKVASPQKSQITAVTKPVEVKKALKDDFDGDILNDFIDSNVSKSAAGGKESSPVKDGKQSNIHSEETDFLDDLSLSQFSPSKDLPSDNSSKNIKINKSSDEKTDILDELNATDKRTSKTSKERRGSFFDDFLQKLSPKHEVKIPPSSIPEKEAKDNEEDEDILGAYIPTAPKKNEKTSDAIIKSPKAREKKASLTKQVSFKDLSDTLPETELDVTQIASPVKESNAKKSLAESKRSEKSIPNRSEKMGSNKSEDIDWLNFFKESPKKAKGAEQPKQKDNLNVENVETAATNKSRLGIRRQSSADWLGLSESKSLDDSDVLGDRDEIKESEIKASSLEIVRPKTANVPTVRTRRQNANKKFDDWLDDDDGLGKDSHPAKFELSQMLKKPDKTETKKSTLVIPKKDATDIAASIAPKMPKSRPTPKVSSHMQVHKDDSFQDSFITEHVVSPKHSAPNFGLHVSQSNDMQMSGTFQITEQASALNSLQLLLDNSMQERNKLMSENESLKLMYEEKLKSMEELYKNQIKASENSYKTLESSLKQEFEIKIKLLEDRLNTLTLEKEKQEKIFKEKLENIEKEHKVEIERLKGLHNHSINIMKEDHEEALSRLKRLKEQELDAVLSTQVHSKSLQHLSDQLEARANELASLQTKVEERNQSSLREKQALLDAKERDLKALQNRLQRQLDDSEDERNQLQQLVLRLEGRLQKLALEGEEDRWEVQQMKAKLTIQKKYLEEEQKLNQHQIEKEKEKLRITQDSLLHEQKTVLLQLAQERQQLTQEKIDLQSLAQSIREEETKLNVRKLKEETYIESQKQFLQEEKNKLHFEKEKIKQELYQIERERNSLQREKQQLSNEKETLHELEMNLKRKSSEIEEIAAVASQEKDKAHREHTAALNIKTEQQFKMQQYSQQMQMLMDKERQILSEKEKLLAEKLEFEQNKNSVVCTKCKLSVGNSIQAPPAELNVPVVHPLGNLNTIPTQVHQSFVDPNLVIWHIAAQKDREFLQEELAYLKSLKESSEEKKYS